MLGHGPHCCCRHIRAAEASRTHLRAPADLARRRKLGRTTGGAMFLCLSPVLRPSTGATSLGHWNAQAWKLQERKLVGSLDPRQDPVWSGCSLAHGEPCPGSQPSLQDVWCPCHPPSPLPGHGSAEHFPVCRGGLVPDTVKGFVTLLPQGLGSDNFPILLLFPTWYLAFLCTASSSAGDEGQPRQQE